MSSDLDELRERFPFLTLLEYAEEEYLGIVQNADDAILSFYDYRRIPNKDMKTLFLKLGDTWWWTSNRKTPINIYLRDQFVVFQPFMLTFSRTEVNVKFGPIISLAETLIRRVRRRPMQSVNAAYLIEMPVLEIKSNNKISSINKKRGRPKGSKSKRQ